MRETATQASGFMKVAAHCQSGYLLAVNPSVCSSVYLPAYLSVLPCLPVCLSIHVCLHVHLFGPSPVFLFIFVSVYIYVANHLSVFMHVCLFICSSVEPFTFACLYTQIHSRFLSSYLCILTHLSVSRQWLFVFVFVRSAIWLSTPIPLPALLCCKAWMCWQSALAVSMTPSAVCTAV